MSRHSNQDTDLNKEKDARRDDMTEGQKKQRDSEQGGGEGGGGKQGRREHFDHKPKD